MIRIGLAPRWEEETFRARGEEEERPAGRIAIFTGTRAELLAGGGTLRIARDLAALEPLSANDLAPFTRAEKAMLARMLARRAA